MRCIDLQTAHTCLLNAFGMDLTPTGCFNDRLAEASIQQQTHLKSVIRGEAICISCGATALIQLCLQGLLFHVLYQALNALCKSAHPAVQQSAAGEAFCGWLSQMRLILMDKGVSNSLSLSLTHTQSC